MADDTDDPDDGDHDAHDPANGDDSGPKDTTSTADRWIYTNDVLAGVLVGLAVVLTGWYLYTGRSVPIWLSTVDALAITTAVVWAFGKGAFAVARDVFGNGGNK